MPDPRIALLLYALTVAALLGLFWPGRGAWWRALRALRRRDGREALEDGLKHLYKSARFGSKASIESLAGVLEITTGQAARLLDHMRRRGLVDPDHPLELTEAGRAYALQVIRTHRLWERYLADRTGLKAAAWHEEAEAREHELTEHEVEELSARLGHPRYDPHGDPIPTASGEIPDPEGRPLSQLREGSRGTILHIEDEPHDLYRELLAAGLHPGMRVEVRGRDKNSFAILADGRAVTLDRMCADNVTMGAPSDGTTGDEDATFDRDAGAASLADLRLGASGRVLGISPECQGSQRRRLLDLGLVPGTTVRAEFASSSGGAVAFQVRGTLIALRPEQQRWIRVEHERVEAA